MRRIWLTHSFFSVSHLGEKTFLQADMKNIQKWKGVKLKSKEKFPLRYMHKRCNQ